VKTKSNIIIIIKIITLMMSGITTSAFAGGPRFDFDERYEDVPRDEVAYDDI
jgi:hypothetical protein